MKRLLLVLFMLVSFMVFAKATLYIYNWADYIPEDVIRAFEEKYNCRVVYDTYASNEEMYAKFKAGGGKGYDLIFPSGDYVSIMSKEGMLQKLDLSRIPNFKYLDKEILAKTTYDPNHEYSVPYMMGSTVVIVNRKYVKEYEKSWSIFEREDLRGRMTLLDDMREVLGAALKYLGYSVNTKNPKELEEAKQVVLRWKRTSPNSMPRRMPMGWLPVNTGWFTDTLRMCTRGYRKEKRKTSISSYRKKEEHCG